MKIEATRRRIELHSGVVDRDSGEGMEALIKQELSENIGQSFSLAATRSQLEIR